MKLSVSWLRYIWKHYNLVKILISYRWKVYSLKKCDAAQSARNFRYLRGTNCHHLHGETFSCRNVDIFVTGFRTIISITIAVRTSLLTFTSLKKCANERLCFQQYDIYIWQCTSNDVRLHDSAFNITTWRLAQQPSTMKEIRSRYDTVYCGHVNELLCVVKGTIIV